MASLLEDTKRPIRTIVKLRSGRVKRESASTSLENDPIVFGAVNYIANHFRRTIDVSDVVTNLGCCRRTLERRFSSILGLTIRQYLSEYRLNFAKICMERERWEKLDVIAKLCGFADSNTFRNAFIRSTGQTPSQWRQLRRRGLNDTVATRN